MNLASTTRLAPASVVAILLTFFTASVGCQPPSAPPIGEESPDEGQVTGETRRSRPSWIMPQETLQSLDPELVALVQRQGDRLESPDDYFALAKIYHANKLQDYAVHAYARYLRSKPNDALAWYLIGECLESQGRLEEAQKAWKSCLNEDPTLVDAYWRLGLAQIETGQLQEAEELLTNAIQRFPETTQLQSVLAKCLVESGKWTAAVSILSKLLEQPQNKAFHTYLLERCRQATQAGSEVPLPAAPRWQDSTLGVLQPLERGVEARRRLANIQFEEGQFEACLVTLDRIIENDPNDYRDWILKTRCLQSLHQIDEAFAAVQQAIRCRSNIYESHMLAAELALKQTEASAEEMQVSSREFLDAALQLDPDRWEAYDAIAQLEILNGQPQAALEHLKQACDKSRKPGPQHLRYLFLTIEQGQLEDARSFVQSLPETYQQDGFVRIAVAQMALASGAPEDAREILEELKTRHKDSQFWAGPIEELEQKIKQQANEEKAPG